MPDAGPEAALAPRVPEKATQLMTVPATVIAVTP